MKLAMTLLVRDEVDIIRQNIEFHLAAGVDHIVAINNRSVDGTREILEEYQHLGVLKLLDEPGDDFRQGQWVSAAALMARDDFGADWVLSSDADEFWVVPGGDIKRLIAAADADILVCKRKNMFQAFDTLDEGGWPDGCIYRASQPVARPVLNDIYTDLLPCPYFYCDLPPKIMVRTRNLVAIAQGNHAAKIRGRAQTRSPDLEIYHYPIRSPGQFRNKITNGGKAHENNRSLPQTSGWHWRRWHRMLNHYDLEAVLKDALPGSNRLDHDILSGAVIRDSHMSDLLPAITDQHCSTSNRTDPE